MSEFLDDREGFSRRSSPEAMARLLRPDLPEVHDEGLSPKDLDYLRRITGEDSKVVPLTPTVQPPNAAAALAFALRNASIRNDY